ncbi:hypothetical protein [Frankia sp. R43]|nr:hypothetical protein [Frankia sp. R43]
MTGEQVQLSIEVIDLDGELQNPGGQPAERVARGGGVSSGAPSSKTRIGR